eukprot:8725564-Alexandrium_andersonii.AAC.1
MVRRMAARRRCSGRAPEATGAVVRARSRGSEPRGRSPSSLSRTLARVRVASASRDQQAQASSTPVSRVDRQAP